MRVLKMILKIGITIFCFWYISTKIDFSQTVQVIKGANILYLITAFLFFFASKIFSSLRLNIYFRNIGLWISERVNLRLYWLGMFYNLFLPGAISGDAYKVILLKRRYGSSYSKTSAAVLLDRFSGVLALGLILCIYGILIFDDLRYDAILITGSVIGLLGFYLLLKFKMTDFFKSYFPTLAWAVLVQLCQVVCIYILLRTVHLPLRHEWILIFLASAIITILPLSLGGGLGTREIVFAEGARFFGLDPAAGVVISLLFYFLTVAGSLPGALFIFQDPLEEKAVG